MAETRAEPVLEFFEFTRRAIACDDDLLAGLVEGVEGVEELDLGLLFVGEELHVVDDEHVVVAVGLLEALDATLVCHGVDEVVGEAFAGDVADVEFRVVFESRVGDGLDEVGLAEAGARIDEHRVVRGGGRLGHTVGDRGGVLVVGSGDEPIEDVARVEVAATLPRLPFLARRLGSFTGSGVGSGVGTACCSASSAARSSTTTRTSTVSPRTSASASATWPASRRSIHSRAKSLGTPMTKAPSSRPSGMVRSNQNWKADSLSRPRRCFFASSQMRVSSSVVAPSTQSGDAAARRRCMNGSQRMLSRRRRPSSRKARLPPSKESINPISCSTASSRKAVAGANPSSLPTCVGPPSRAP